MADADAQRLDLDVVRARYAAERDARVAAGDRRYLDIADFSPDLIADPYTPRVERDPINDEVDVLVVGGGFGGLLTAARLKQAGVPKVRIVEAGGDVGGAWYWNRYPGAACDVESYIYLPLLEETGYMPTERYAKAAEIREHCRRIARHFGIYDEAVFSTQVTRLSWKGGVKRWEVATDRGDLFRAQFVALTTGPLNRPKLPNIRGIETFRGHQFHTSRWDYAYTDGSATEPMVKLADKRVGIIGTGATAIQCIPPLARSARHLSVFQRTPSALDVRNNSQTDREWYAGLESGWQQKRIESFTSQFTGDLHVPDLVGDGWTILAKAAREKFAADPTRSPEQIFEEADLEAMARVRERIDELVDDQATADALKPWYSLHCKRPCFHDDYLTTFNRPNVTLVDTKGHGVEEIRETSIVAGGLSHELDCLIFATGFETSTDYSKRSGFEVVGVDGQALHDKWADGMISFHGMHSRGFPNCFVMSQTQSGMSVNFPHMIDEQSRHLAYLIAGAQERGTETVEATEEAEQRWVQAVIDLSEQRRQFLATCTPGFYNNEGRRSAASDRNLPFGAGPIAFVNILREWRKAGTFEGLELDGAHASAVTTHG